MSTTDGAELSFRARVAPHRDRGRLDKAHKRIGELSMENELLRKERDKTAPFALRKSRR